MASRPEKIAAAFAVPDVPEFPLNYDVRPSTPIAVIAIGKDGITRRMAFLPWGLVPHWSTTAKPKHVPINIRSETALFKFGDQVRHKRILIPADGFYEWSGEKKARRKYRIAMRDEKLLAFAGVWDLWEGDGRRLVTCAFLTTTPNELVKPYHDRMPVIVPPESYAEWLDPSTPLARVEALFHPYPADLMELADVTLEKDAGPSLFAAEVV